MPCLQPPEIWQQSGRYQALTDVLFKVRDRAKKEWLLGPTHEEVITTLAASEISSYRQLPKNFYQIQTKFRDEIRPRFGLMRAREFVMKDAYSFDASDEAAQLSYQKMYDAYARIFARCGLQAFPVEADTGIIGGKFSHEFMVPAETGENEVVYCESGQYSANIEKAQSRGALVATPTIDTGAAPERFATPGVGTIDQLSKPPYGVPAHQQIKTHRQIAATTPRNVRLRGEDTMKDAKRAAQNGTTGTDHGWASCILAAGGLVKTAGIVADWPGLGKARLFEGRDLAATVDANTVYAEALSSVFGLTSGQIRDGVLAHAPAPLTRNLFRT